MSGFLQGVSETGVRAVKLERSSISIVQVVYNCRMMGMGKKVKNKVNGKMSEMIIPF